MEPRRVQGLGDPRGVLGWEELTRPWEQAELRRQRVRTVGTAPPVRAAPPGAGCCRCVWVCVGARGQSALGPVGQELQPDAQRPGGDCEQLCPLGDRKQVAPWVALGLSDYRGHCHPGLARCGLSLLHGPR